MDAINVFDICVAVLVLMLGIKGIMNGLIREVFGLIGLIGGIVVASRFAGEAGRFISDKIYKLDNDSILFFAGFLSILIIFWSTCLIIAAFLSKLAGLSGLGILNKLGGFVTGSLKIFLIFSVLVVTVADIGVLDSKLKPYLKDSILHPILLKTGKWIMNMDVNKVKQSIEKSIEPFNAENSNNVIQIDSNKTQIDSNETKADSNQTK
ncbi:CvpA family protein [Campylobacter sp.]|uniref:CvpA family protein n=1 Tax=Campylobacter sp. TaxID=205 RepID=UPI00270255A7|nr:CvpA family protein [Campylobacter sp.]